MIASIFRNADLVYRVQLLNKDFYHLSATTFEFKDTAPNGVAFKVTGKSSHEKATSAAVSSSSCLSLRWVCMYCHCFGIEHSITTGSLHHSRLLCTKEELSADQGQLSSSRLRENIPISPLVRLPEKSPVAKKETRCPPPS